MSYQKRLVFIFLLIIVFFDADPTAGAGFLAKDAPPVRVMTFNIKYNEPRDQENAWANRKEKVAGVIRFHKADLIGLQEALIDQINDLEKRLPNFAWCGAGRNDGKSGGEFSAIFYRKARFRLLETSTFWLSETPDKPGSIGWEAGYPRIVTWAKLRDHSTKKTFFHFNTHFDNRSERARRESSKYLLSQIEKIAGKSPFVVTGDFNFKEDSESYRLLTGSNKLKDTRYISDNEPFGPTSTFNNFGALIPGMKIDYIFVKDGIRVLEHGVLADQWDGRWASDHLPVLSEIVMR